MVKNLNIICCLVDAILELKQIMFKFGAYVTNLSTFAQLDNNVFYHGS